MEARFSTTVQHLAPEPLFPVQHPLLTQQQRDAIEREARKRDMTRLRAYQEEQLVTQYRQEARLLDFQDFARKEKQAEALGTKLTHQLEELASPELKQTNKR